MILTINPQLECEAALIGNDNTKCRRVITTMSQQLDTIARIALSGAIVDTFETGAITRALPINPEINLLLVQLKIATERAFDLYDRVTARGLARVDRKIKAIKTKTSIGKPLSIITFIEFALCVMDGPARKCKGARLVANRNIVEILKALHREISGGREFMLSSMAASSACDVWDGIEI
jgi:hypothetical protein